MTTINLLPKILDLVLYAGDGVRFSLVVTDKDDIPVPLTGSMEAQIRTKRGSVDPPAAEFTIDLTNSGDGVAVLSLTGEDTQALALTKKFSGAWDIQWTPLDSEPRTLCQGKVECDPDVSR